MTEPACDFYCEKILKGLTAVPVCFENEHVFAFHHTNPIWENHVVLLPRRHVESLIDLGEADNELLLELMRAAKMIARDFMERFGAARVYTNLGEYQSSKHLHWHIGCGKQLRPY
jgi:histidine triad (HIT) family protein